MRSKRSMWIMLLSLALAVLLPGQSFGHGYTTGPVSRAYHCKLGTAKNCGPIQYEPQSIEGPKGFPSRGPADGRICAGGLSQFAQLDDPRGGTWPATKLTSGGNAAFRWTLSAAHATTSFTYFITKNGWKATSPLTRSALDPAPFLAVNLNGRPSSSVLHTGKIPAGKSGRHLILAVWNITDTGNAFYQCIDVNL